MVVLASFRFVNFSDTVKFLSNLFFSVYALKLQFGGAGGTAVRDENYGVPDASNSGRSAAESIVPGCQNFLNNFHLIFHLLWLVS